MNKKQIALVDLEFKGDVDDIFGRYVDFESHIIRSSYKSRHGHISP